MDNAFPLEDCSSIRAASEDLTSDFFAFLSMEAACELTLTDDVLKDVSVAFSLAGARLPTLALGRFAKSLAGWCFDGFLGGAMLVRGLCSRIDLISCAICISVCLCVTSYTIETLSSVIRSNVASAVMECFKLLVAPYNTIDCRLSVAGVVLSVDGSENGLMV